MQQCDIFKVICTFFTYEIFQILIIYVCKREGYYCSSHFVQMRNDYIVRKKKTAEDDMRGSENGMTINLMHFFSSKFREIELAVTQIL